MFKTKLKTDKDDMNKGNVFQSGTSITSKATPKQKTTLTSRMKTRTLSAGKC